VFSSKEMVVTCSKVQSVSLIAGFIKAAVAGALSYTKTASVLAVSAVAVLRLKIKGTPRTISVSACED
jgi:hypothetical protein